MKLLHLPAVLMIMLLTACEREMPLPAITGTPRVVIYSELTAGQAPVVLVGKSKVIGPGVDNGFDLVKNAIVQLTTKDGNLVETLSLNSDSNSLMSSYSGKTTLAAGTNYRVIVNVPDMKEALASALIPPAPTVVLHDTLRTLLNGRPVLRFNFIISPQPAGRQFIVMEALKQSATVDIYFTYNGVRYNKAENEDLYEQVKNQHGVLITKDTTFLNDYLRIPVYTQDENADNNQIGGLNENYNTILFSQTNKTINTNLYINATALSSSPAEAIAPKGRVLVYVKAVSKEYYDFLMTYEKVKRNPGLNSLIQAIQLRNNTVGGLGIVGGSNQVLYSLYYDEL